MQVIPFMWSQFFYIGIICLSLNEISLFAQYILANDVLNESRNFKSLIAKPIDLNKS